MENQYVLPKSENDKNKHRKQNVIANFTLDTAACWNSESET